MRNTNFLAFIVSEISAFIRTDKQTDMTILYRVGIPSFLLLSDESSLPFYSTSKGYKLEQFSVLFSD